MLHTKKNNSFVYSIGTAIVARLYATVKKCERHWGENINKRRKDAYKWNECTWLWIGLKIGKETKEFPLFLHWKI